jgi:hypothetical protein
LWREELLRRLVEAREIESMLRLQGSVAVINDILTLESQLKAKEANNAAAMEEVASDARESFGLGGVAGPIPDVKRN